MIERLKFRIVVDKDTGYDGLDDDSTDALHAALDSVADGGIVEAHATPAETRHVMRESLSVARQIGHPCRCVGREGWIDIEYGAGVLRLS